MGGLVAGVLDLASAIGAWLPSGMTPLQIMQSIAGGLYGRRTYEGGWSTAIVGLALHFLIATTAAAIYYAASRKLRFMTERPVLSGVIYAELVYLFMNFVVIPLSAIHRWPTFKWQQMVTGPVGHIFFVGLPIALAVSWFAPLPASGASSPSRR